MPRRNNISYRSNVARRSSRLREQENEEQLNQRLHGSRQRMARSRSNTRNQNIVPARFNFELAAFNYNCQLDYSSHKKVIIGKMEKICEHCNALKFGTETPGLCCASGKVKLRALNCPPEPLHSLVSGTTTQSKHYLNNIQAYNGCFQMTSFGATNIIKDNFMPTFKIQGQVYHKVGSLLPFADKEHQFLQIYFLGNSNDQINQRCSIAPNTVRRQIVGELQDLLHEHNALVSLFKIALDRIPSDDHKVIIRADKTPSGQHAGRFNAPTVDDVAIVITGEQFLPRDIVLQRRNNQLQRVSELHRSYDALQYPLLFWEGDDGYHVKINSINPTTGLEIPNKTVSSMNYYAYRLMIRQNEQNHILKCRKLFHQYVVDMYAKIESERLNYLRFNQTRLRAEEYIHLRDAIHTDGNQPANPNDIGQLTILPSSYVGSPRHMHEYAQDAMTYVRSYGRPDLFVTFTCNPQWSEIKEHLMPGQSPSDRHDIIARVFRQKLKTLIDFIVKHNVFGEVRCYMYSVEWQKRGLPHAHILIWLVNKIRPNQIDDIISAEIPDQTTDPELYEVVTKNMIHGPCGALNTNSPCMVDGKCSKRYPRDFVAETVTGNDGYPLYRRCSTEDNGKTATIQKGNQQIEVNNRWVVPYCPILSKTFKAHINMEYCNSVKAIKYVCKYINKGSDMAVFGVVDPNKNDEINQFQLGRYISSNEAIWRIFSFPIHERHPNVVHLSVHLENGQRVYFTTENAHQRAAAPPATTLTEFYKLCTHDTFARTLLYSEVPQFYTWDNWAKIFHRRKKGKPLQGQPNVFQADSLGRIYNIHPNNAECFYLRLLLVNVRGPTSFENIKMVHGLMCPTYRDACQRLGLLEEDTHWEATLADASISSSAHQIRTLFAIIISTCHPSNPLDLWENYKDFMSEDILYRIRCTTSNMHLLYSPEMYNETLIMIEDLCFMIANKSLAQLGMVSPNRSAQDLFNRDIQRERGYNCNELRVIVQDNIPKLNNEQKHAYDSIMDAVSNERGGLYFLDAPGGTGKTFLISLLLATIRSQSKIAIALASSGIAATLLDGGRTAHSALKLPLNMQANENPTCNISKTSGMAKVLQECAIIVWDECPMAHKKSLEALDRTMKDLRGNQQLFGGALLLLAGDFRQTLPVIPKSTAADEINSCLKSSILWRYVKKLTLKTNVRVQLQNDSLAGEFSKQLLQIGDGNMPVDRDTGLITLPDNFCRMCQSKQDLINSVFPNISRNYLCQNWLSERAILAAKNKDVNEINEAILKDIPGQIMTYKSVDTVVDPDEVVNFPVEFLNSLDLPGLPPHILQLKVGVSIILLRNINQPKLCNGTKLSVKKLMGNVIEATILTGKFKGEDVLIPRIKLIPTDMPFEFKRLQFPVRLAFAMTINKSQGQTLQMCGLNLENSVFSHGQLYVACSRVGKPNSLFIFTNDGKTKNVVYKKALE